MNHTPFRKYGLLRQSLIALVAGATWCSVSLAYWHRHDHVTISGTPATSVTAGQAYSFTPSATDSEARALAFAIANKPSWATFSASTGQLSGTPPAASVGTYSNIVIAVSDSLRSATLPAFAVQVLAGSGGSPPPPPTISGTPATSDAAGHAYSFQPSASGPSGTTLSFSVQNLPSWATFSVASGLLSGTPTSAQTGTYGNIVVSVSDGTASAALPAFSIQVTSTAVTPTVTLNASPNTVTSGAASMLSWSSTNATSCMASGNWSGSMGMSGSQGTGALSNSATYTLSCTGAGGTATQSVAVNVTSTTPPTGSSCSATSGSLSLKASAVRGTGVSPFLVFFDATGTTDSSITGSTTAFQDVSYSWNFGDTGASGSDAWAYGSNAGRNSRNTATGGVAAHLYETAGVDTAYVVTVTAHNGSGAASCQLGVTGHDPTSANGFPGAKTTCVSSSGTPVAGSGGCPAGAAVVQTSSTGSALSGSRSGLRTLFKCGDTFTGGATISGVTWSIGAYGGCQDTQSNRPIMHGTLNVNMQSTGDGRIADLDFESTGGAAVLSNSNYDYIPYQITLYNLLSNGNNTSFYTAQGAQWGYIQLVQTGMGTQQGTYINYAQNNQSQWGSNSLYNNIDYQAVLGSSFNGVGAANSGGGIETVRVSACRMCVFENNVFENANNIGAVFKLHNGNTKITNPTWTGVYTEYIMETDNVFSGTSGAILVENAPQNSVTDERLRNIVVERNIFAGRSTGGGRQILVSAVNETLRDNVFNGTVAGGGSGAQIAQRGIEPQPQYVEFYDNTCYGGGSCAAFSGQNFAAPGINGFARNNLFYNSGVIDNSGSGNAISNNTVSPSSNPGFMNGSGTLSLIPDFKPTANYSGGMSVPVWFDALGTPFSPTWDLGALHQ